MLDFPEKYQIHSEIVFVHLYRRRVNWCFMVFITLNILLWLENILLFGLVFMIWVCGSTAIRESYPYLILTRKNRKSFYYNNSSSSLTRFFRSQTFLHKISQ